MATFAGVLATNAGRCPDRPALVFGERSYSYRDVNAAVNRAAHALAAAGLHKGDRMVLMSANSDDFYIALYAAWRLGALVIPVNPASTAAELRYLLDDSQAALVVFGVSAADTVGKCAQTPSSWWTSSPIALGPVEGYQELAVLAASHPDTAPTVDVAETDDAAILYTSGTTGRPERGPVRSSPVLWVAWAPHLCWGCGMAIGCSTWRRCITLPTGDAGCRRNPDRRRPRDPAGIHPDAVLDALEKHSSPFFSGCRRCISWYCAIRNWPAETSQRGASGCSARHRCRRRR